MNYHIGTIVQHKNRFKYVKTAEGRWVPEHRVIAAHSEDRELTRYDRVFHKDGDRENNAPENLAAIHFNETRYVPLERSMVIYVPKEVADENARSKQKLAGRPETRIRVARPAVRRSVPVLPNKGQRYSVGTR